MRILGIDQSFTNTGWCLLDDGEVVKYGLISSDKNLDYVQRAMDIAREIGSLDDTWQPDKVIIEGLSFMSKSPSFKYLAGLKMLIEAELRQHRSFVEDIIEVPPSALKKFATGSGKADKKDMYDSLPRIVQEKFKTTLKTKGRSDITDAYWLAMYGEKL